MKPVDMKRPAPSVADDSGAEADHAGKLISSIGSKGAAAPQYLLRLAVALWTLHAHAHDTAAISPILAVTSPTPECGKTTLLTILHALVPRPLPASNITAAALFRAVEKWQPTLLIDEADTFLRNSDELRGVINSGHNRPPAASAHGRDCGHRVLYGRPPDLSP